MGLFEQLTGGLVKTKQAFVDKVTGIVTGKKQIDAELFEELEEALVQADIGIQTALNLVANLRKKVKTEGLHEAGELRRFLEEEIINIIKEGQHELILDKDSLNVILLVGVNGAGKTTTIGKLSYRLRKKGFKVLVAAADTFRAAAIDQLQVWCERAGVDIVKQKEGSDPAAVVFDAVQAAKARKVGVLIIDTAGRLQTKTNLIEELKKIRRILERECPESRQEILLTLDATTGQNALSQAKTFSEAVGVNGVVLTKIDGTAKGGVILGIQDEYKLPVKFIGTGEKIENLEEFDPDIFSRALLG